MGTESLVVPQSPEKTVASLERLGGAEELTKNILPFRGEFEQLGMAEADGGGYNFAVAIDSENVHAVDVCIHDDTDPFRITQRWRLTETLSEVEPPTGGG